MKAKWSKVLLAGTLSLAVAGGAIAQMSVEDQIKTRQSAYTFAGWNMEKIRAQVIDGSVPFDPVQVQAAANAIAAIANSGLGALYGPGTAEGVGWKQTRLDPKFFDEPERVRDIAIRFINEANKLQEVAAAGDRRAIARQFGEVGQACRACHTNYRLPE